MTLIEKVEAATVGSRELDAEIWWWVDHKAAQGAHTSGVAFSNREWTEDEKRRKGDAKVKQLAPHYTTSLDAALPGENIVTVNRQFRDGREVWQAVQAGQHVAYAPTEPLARRIAALKARGV